jgi:hypothetical protein
LAVPQAQFDLSNVAARAVNLLGDQSGALQASASRASRNVAASVNANGCRCGIEVRLKHASDRPISAVGGQPSSALLCTSKGGEQISSSGGVAMSELAENLLKFAKQRLGTMVLLPDYLKSVIAHWNDIFFSSIPMLPFVVWWYLGEPPMAIKAIVFLWVFVAAGYYAWREEHLKHVSDDFNCWIYAGATDPTAQLLGARSIRVFIGLRIVNVGPQSSIHTWQVSYNKSGQTGRTHLADGMLVTGEIGNLPDLIRGQNLHGDIRLLATGETREGWIAFDVGENDGSDPEILTNVSLGFTDAFDKFHEVTQLSGWRREPK